MNDADSMVLSVRADARQLVAPDYAVLDGLIEHTAHSKTEALQLVTASLDRLTADLTARGAVPFDEDAGHRPLTWSAHSAATREERYHDQVTGRVQRSGLVTATVALRVTVRDLDALDDLSGVLAAHPSLNVRAVTWHVDRDNSAWPQVRAAAIAAAGLLGGDTVPYQPGRLAARSLSAGIEQPGTPALNPVPQELIATIEARFRTTALEHSWQEGPHKAWSA